MKRMCRPPAVTAGFTLIEVMIVVAIVGILASIALPSYQSHVVKTRRTDAQRELLTYAQSLERYYSVNGRYTTANDNNTCGVDSPSITYYDFSVTTNAAGTTPGCEPNSFVVRLTPKDGASQANDGWMSLDNTNLKAGQKNDGNWAK